MRWVETEGTFSRPVSQDAKSLPGREFGITIGKRDLPGADRVHSRTYIASSWVGSPSATGPLHTCMPHLVRYSFMGAPS